jgi:3-hydroxybutyryl-CoA dehydrogenase
MSDRNTLSIQNVLIYGYGVMGKAVANTFTKANFNVSVVSSRAKQHSTIYEEMTFYEELPEETPDLVIEFVPENLVDKKEVYRLVEDKYKGAPLISSGTSGLDLIKLASDLAFPEKFLGLHYFMPAETTSVVEVMAGPSCPKEDIDLVSKILNKTGKETVVLYQPVVGFLINRLQHIILHECYNLIEDGVASPEDIDMSARKMLGPRMCLNGLIQQKDISGLKIHADAQRSIVPELHPIDTPNQMLQNMVNRGEGGLSDGEGFYDWSGLDVQKVREQASSRLTDLSKYLASDSDQEIIEPKPRSFDKLVGK